MTRTKSRVASLTAAAVAGLVLVQAGPVMAAPAPDNRYIKQSTLRIRTTDPTGVQTGKALTLVNPTSEGASITGMDFPYPFTYDTTAGTCGGTYVPADSSCTILVYLQPPYGTAGSWAETATIQFGSSPIYIDTVQLIGTYNYRP